MFILSQHWPQILILAIDVLQMVYGNTKWALDFTQYLLDDLFALAREFEPVLDDQEALAQKGEYESIF